MLARIKFYCTIFDGYLKYYNRCMSGQHIINSEDQSHCPLVGRAVNEPSFVELKLGSFTKQAKNLSPSLNESSLVIY